jgi:hypothetical protein
MSKRNTREAKARRRAERAARKVHPSRELATVQPVDGQYMAELARQAEAGETLPCGCDAHQMLHDVLQIQDGYLPPGWTTEPL